MLTPEQIADGWIAHDGGPCPVPLESRPGVMFGDGFIRDKPTRGDTAGRYFGIWNNWQWLGPTKASHIIAYRPEPKP